MGQGAHKLNRGHALSTLHMVEAEARPQRPPCWPQVLAALACAGWRWHIRSGEMHNVNEISIVDQHYSMCQIGYSKPSQERKKERKKKLIKKWTQKRIIWEYDHG